MKKLILASAIAFTSLTVPYTIFNTSMQTAHAASTDLANVHKKSLKGQTINTKSVQVNMPYNTVKKQLTLKNKGLSNGFLKYSNGSNLLYFQKFNGGTYLSSIQTPFKKQPSLKDLENEFGLFEVTFPVLNTQTLRYAIQKDYGLYTILFHTNQPFVIEDTKFDSYSIVFNRAVTDEMRLAYSKGQILPFNGAVGMTITNLKKKVPGLKLTKSKKFHLYSKKNTNGLVETYYVDSKTNKIKMVNLSSTTPYAIFPDEEAEKPLHGVTAKGKVDLAAGIHKSGAYSIRYGFTKGSSTVTVGSLSSIKSLYNYKSVQ